MTEQQQDPYDAFLDSLQADTIIRCKDELEDNGA